MAAMLPLRAAAANPKELGGSLFPLETQLKFG
jgi:hypothetical protein